MNLDVFPAEVKSLIEKKKFFPSSVILNNFGKSNHLHSTHVIDMVKDALSVARKVHSSGAGVGFNAVKYAAVAQFIRDLDAQSVDYVKACASCVTIPIWHDEILQILSLKKNTTDFMSVVIQIGISDSFMDAVKEDGDYALRDPITKNVSRVVKAKEIFDAITTSISQSGNPGIVFIDTINNVHPFPQMVSTTDVCGVMPLNSGESSPLGSINVSLVNSDELESVVRSAVSFLDDCIGQCVEVDSKFSLAKRRRKIGLGIMGLAEYLDAKGMDYDSEEGREVAAGLMEKILAIALGESQKRAASLGKIMDMNQASAYGMLPIRNATLLGIAPTGTISSFASVTAGMQSSSTCSGEGQVRMQAALQKHVDNAISNTIHCSCDEVEELMFLAHSLKCKGVSFFVKK